ncbi:MAG: protein adenylyltransferase SelO [Acidimicrobiales bacterium]
MQLRFTNSFTSELTADPVADNHLRQVEGAHFSRVEPVVPSAPEVVALSAELIDQLGLGDEADGTTHTASDAFVDLVSGRAFPDGADPYAMVYGGHQFGNWAGQLGDGRAIAIGEVETSDGGRRTLQLKGAGPTPYSRGADGMAVLRSSIREFLCSEAMHHLGVPTTRALSLVVTGDKVMRDMLYDGNPAPEPGAVVCRVSPDFLRFGNFQLPAARGDDEGLRALVAYTIRHHFGHLLDDGTSDLGRGVLEPDDLTADLIIAWFTEVIERTADLMVEWMRVGFVHGVMNTDNLSILGETIDYGPYGWQDDYDPDWTPNTTDRAHRRYRFGQQPMVAHWNLAQLGNALVGLLDETDQPRLQAAFDTFPDRYRNGYRTMMAAKLGLSDHPALDDVADDDDRADLDELIVALDQVLRLTETDMTLFFRLLADLPAGTQARSDRDLVAPIVDAYYAPDELTGTTLAAVTTWLRRYLDELAEAGTPDDERRAATHAVNPLYVLRNFQAQLAIDAAETGDFSVVRQLLDVLRRPYTEQPGADRFAEKRPDWARTRAGCSMLSCSS